MNKGKNQYLIFAIILITAFAIRAWNINTQEFVGDEAVYSFRSVGYLDFLGTSFQTQPVDWYRDTTLPFWTKLSFHDHPPLFFAVQHVFFRIFGDSIAVARLPSVLAGVAATLLIFAVAKKLFPKEEDEKKHLLLPFFSSALFAIQYSTVWIFGVSLIEAILIPLILANILAFFLYISDGRRWWVFGLTLGLLGLTKYTAMFLIPVYVFYGLTIRKKIWKDPRFYAAMTGALLIMSPVIAYNIALYSTRGHFDLQLAYLLGQETPEWTGLVGKTQSPFRDIGANLLGSYGIVGLTLAAGGVIYSLTGWQRKRNRESIVFLWLYVASVTLTLIFVGAAHRFLALYGPASTIFVAYLFALLWNTAKRTIMFRAAVVAAVIALASHTIFAQIARATDYGVAQLDRYFEKEFRGKVSGVTPGSDHPQLNRVIQRFSARKQKGKPHLSVLVYNENMGIATILWNFTRRLLYQNIPTMYVENFQKVLQEQGENFFAGFTIYFVQSTENTILNPFKTERTAGAEFESSLQAAGFTPVETIYGSDNAEMFRIYKFVSGARAE